MSAPKLLCVVPYVTGYIAIQNTKYQVNYQVPSWSCRIYNGPKDRKNEINHLIPLQRGAFASPQSRKAS